MHQRALAILLWTVSAATAGLGQGALSGIAIPPGSQDASCFPVWHGVYAVNAPPYPLDVNSGIGNLVRTQSYGAYAEFALHDHVYSAPQFPDASRAVVDFEFRWPVAVFGVEIIQHTNGVTKIEGLGGDALSSLVSVGQAFGPAGDISGFNLIPEFESHTFLLPAPACGTRFRVVVRKTSFVNGWATYRFFPLDAAGVRIAAASSPPALAVAVASASSAGGLDVDLVLSAGPGFALAPYVMVGSVGGACPGIAIAGLGTLPVVYDLFSAYTLYGPFAPQTTGYQSVLDGAGSGAAHIDVAPGAYPQLVGLTFTHAAAIVGASEVLFTNPASFTVLL